MSDATTTAQTCPACAAGECDDHLDFAGLLSRQPAEHGPSRAARRADRSADARQGWLDAAATGATPEQCKAAARRAAGPR